MGTGSISGKLNLSFEKDDAVKAGRFLIFFVLVYLVLSLFIRGIVSIEAVELWVANNVLGFLSAAGYPGTVSLAENALIELESGIVIEISELCTGLTETLIIVGAILASAGVSWRRRFLGAAIAGAVTILFNYVRIIATVLLILSSPDVAMIEFTHNILFRLFLFLTVFGLYVGWFYWAMSREAGQKA